MVYHKISRKKLIGNYLNFFKKKNHQIIPPSSLLPERDPTVLFTTAGMHPLIPYLLGEKHPLGKRLVNIQNCIRTKDIEKVGNKTHITLFEMLGNWSLGDYWKEDAIKWSFEFLTKNLKINKKYLAVTCFQGDKYIPRDETSARIWESLGINKERIVFLGKNENWWGPAGKTGPCGPDTEIFYWSGKENPPKEFNPKNEKWIEIWNNVFMEYKKVDEDKYETLVQKNVDTGMGLERMIALLNKFDDLYLTEIFEPLVKEIEHLSKQKYGVDEEITKSMRIIMDHIRASVFIISDGIIPSNTERGYVLRRIIRRSIKYGRINLGLKEDQFIKKIAEKVIEIYSKDYPELKKNKEKILEVLEIEEKGFNKTIKNGFSAFKKIMKKKGEISGKDTFLLYQSYGFPIELLEEISTEEKIKINKKEFYEELKKHQKKSKTSTKQKFESGMSDHTDKTIKLHTATHLLNESLKRVLGPEIKQKGSNINPERLRFDFNFKRKLSENEIKAIENLVNQKINEDIPIKIKQMTLKDAIKGGAEAEFGSRYPEMVSVYSIGNFSKEICTGPHVKKSSEIGKFKIIKEESVASGVRRIRAKIEE